MRIHSRFAHLLGVSLALALVAAPAAAQQTGALAGAVTDTRTGDPVVGVAVQAVEANRYVLTNADGRFLLRDVPVGEQTIRLSKLGYGTIEDTVTITAGTTTQNFELSEEAIQLDAIVVTGQQIERQAREIGYSVSTVQGEDLTKVRETNMVNSLAGRAPGVQVMSQSGDVGASTRIVIRGVSSLSGNNQPLFVVDGTPIYNSNIVGGTSQDRLTGAIDVGNRAADLTADDIESVTVLRGAAAAATYGQRAKNGVILITTKKGRSVGGYTITASTTVRSSSPLVLPDFQNEYAQGSNAIYSSTSLNGWGPQIAGQRVENINGDSITLQAFPDNVENFYDDALLTIQSASVSAADDNADFRLGVTYQDQDGIVPSSNQTRTSINLNTGYQLLPELSARVSGFYVNTESRGRAVAGGNNPNVLTSIVNGLPRTLDTNELENYKDEFGNQNAIGTFTNNPYWVVNENPFTNEVGRIFGNGSVEYSPVEWLNLTGRAGIDTYTEDRRNVNAIGTIGRETGRLSLDVIQEQQLDYTVQAEANRQLNEDFSLRAVLGGNLNETTQEIQRNTAQDLTVPGLYNFANASANTPANSFQRRKIYGVYMDATIGFREYLFLNLTGRNDWSSTLPKDNNSFFYPSANLSFILTEALDFGDGPLSYAKLRANYAQVGSDEAPYQLDFRFFPVSGIFGQYGTGVNFPFGGRVGFQATDVIPPQDLKPQRQNSFEIGGEFQFFNGRAGIDLTYYDVRTEDQIISIPIPESTGFGANRTNIGEVSNEGIEAQLNLTPVSNRLVNWDLLVNYSANDNKVVSLAPGVEEIIIQSAFNSLQVKAEPGQSFGLYGPGFLRDSISGLPIIDPTTGLRQEGDITRLGSIDPDFRVGVSNALTVGDVTLSFLVDWREGGVMFSNTVGSLRRQGLSEETAVGRGGTYIDEGVIDNGDGTFRPNDVPVSSMQAFWTRYADAGIHEGNVFDASNARLREVRLDWSVPRDWLTRTPFGSLSVGFEARNLWLFYRKVPHIDPEIGLFGSASEGQGVEWDVLPSTRSFGFNIQARF
ncbi:MAG: SusC/RagA family TonB-linked outer membrane protein [Candidatus Longimicrobiales bacterium M2_2A_002]